MTLVEFLKERIDEDEASVLGMDCHCPDPIDAPLASCPYRVLVDCEGKRAIIDMWQLSPPVADAWLTPVLVTLAQPFSGHPDFDASWGSTE